MYCGKCGQKIDENELFCSNCGTKVKQVKNFSGQRQRKKFVKKVGFSILVFCLLTAIAAGASVYYHQITYQYLAVVRDKNGKYGFMNEKGKEIIPCKYDNAYGFQNNGLAAVEEKVGKDSEGRDLFKWGYINRKGKEVISLKYDKISEARFEENGLCAVAEEGDLSKAGDIIYFWGFINEEGEEVIPCQYSEVRSDRWNCDGLRCVEKRVKMGSDQTISWRYGVIDEKGEEVIPFEYEDIRVSDSELFAAEKKTATGNDGIEIYQWGFINQKNEIVIPFEYDDVDAFADNGLAAVCKKTEDDEEQWGFIDQNGTMVIPFQFSDAGSFGKNGLAAVKNEEKNCGFIDQSGTIIIPYNYISSDGFGNRNIARVLKYTDTLGYTYGLLKNTGEEAVPCEYTDIWIRDNYAILWKEVGDHYKKGLTDLEATIIIPTQYDMVSDWGDNDWAVVGTMIGEYDSTEQYDEYRRCKYSCKYIDKNNKEVMKVPDQYIYAEQFIKVK